MADDLEGMVHTLAGFGRRGLTRTIAAMEQDLRGMTRAGCPAFLDENGINRGLLGAARQMKDLAREIHTIVHAIGIAACLPHILEKDEVINTASLGAGNDPTRAFDLATNHRVIEFKFSRWSGRDALRRKSLFKDFVKLALGPDDKRKVLYVVGADIQERFLARSKSDPMKMLNRSGNIGPEFARRFKGSYATVRTFYADFKDTVRIIDASEHVSDLISEASTYDAPEAAMMKI
jgi:hypothetical protein